MDIKTAGLITLVWFILQSLYLLIISLDAGTFEVLTWATVNTTVTSFLMWNTLTLVLYKLIKKPAINQNYLLLVIILFVSYAVFQPIKTLIVTSISHYLVDGSILSVAEIFSRMPYIAYYINFTQYIFVFCMCLGLIHIKNSNQMKFQSIELEKKAAKAELNLSDMKMQVLQAQLSPHFLFNSLNSISGLIRISAKNKSLDAIASLGDLLRFSLNASNSSFISLDEEIEFTNHYVDLQRLRFNDFFTIEIDYDNSLNKLLCPPFILQTLIENAFTHAVINKKTVIHIHASITKKVNTLNFCIKNTLPTQKNEPENNNGLALDNLRNRLSLLYHGNFLIQQDTHDGNYYSKVQIPLSEQIYVSKINSNVK